MNMPEEASAETSLISIGREFTKLFSRIKGHMNEKWGQDTVDGATIVHLIEQVAIHDREATRQHSAHQAGSSSEPAGGMTCKNCGIPMVVRNGPSGSTFWACPNYKADKTGCNYTVNISNAASHSGGGDTAPAAQPAQVQGDPGPTDDDIPF